MPQNKKHELHLNLHPTDNSGESVDATVKYENRTMSLELHAQGYGNHSTTMYVSFNEPATMRNLGKMLIEIADKAEQDLEENL